MLKSKNKTSKPKAEEEYFSNRADQSDSDNNQAKDSSGDEKSIIFLSILKLFKN
jgi:hypothetical protein